jgi:hypothetical protein
MLRLAHMQGTTSLLEMTKAFTAPTSGAWAGYDTPASRVKCHWQDMGDLGFPLHAKVRVAEGIMELWQRAAQAPE